MLSVMFTLTFYRIQGIKPKQPSIEDAEGIFSPSSSRFSETQNDTVLAYPSDAPTPSQTNTPGQPCYPTLSSPLPSS